MKFKNPFRTRYAVQTEQFSGLGEIVTRWVVVYRKWWQRSWYYAQWDYSHGIKTPLFHKTKEDINKHLGYRITHWMPIPDIPNK